MALVELGGGVQAHAGPHRIQELAERRRAQAVVGVLEDLRVVVEPPHHQVGLGAEAGHVVEAADFRARALHVVQGFGDDAAALVVVGGQGLTEREHGVEGVVLLVVDLVEVDVRRVARVGDAGVRGVRVGRRLGTRVAGLVARGVLTDAVRHSCGMSRVFRVLLGRYDGVGMRGRHGVLLSCGWLTGGSGGRAGRMRGGAGVGAGTSRRGMAWARRGEAAVARADGVEGAGAGNRHARGVLASRLGRALFEHVDQGGHEGRIRRDGVGTLVGDPQARGGLLRLGVEVVDDLHVITDESDGDDDCAGQRACIAGDLLEEIVDIGFEPAGLRGAGPRAIHEVVAQIGAPQDAPQLRHDRLNEGVVLGDVADFGCGGSRLRRGTAPLLLGARTRGRHGLVDRGTEGEGRGPRLHAHGDGVGDEDQAHPGRVDAARSEGLPRTPDGRDLRARHAGGRVVGADLVQDDVGVGVVGAILGAQCDPPPLVAQGLRGLGEIFAVLATPRVRGIGRGRQDEDASGTRLGEFIEAFGDEGVPVAVSPPDGNVVPAPGELRGQVGDQALIAGVDGRDAAEALVVGGDLEQALVGDSATARRVAHERQDVVRAIRATVGQQHDRVVGFQTWHFQSSFTPSVDSVGPLLSPVQRQIVRKTR